MHGDRYLKDARGLTIPDGSWPSGREAPGALELVRRFCNTTNPETGAELLRTSAELERWLAVEAGVRSTATDADLAAVHALRAAIRALAVANQVAGGRELAAAAFDAAVGDRAASVRLLPEPGLEPHGSPVDAFLVRIAALVYAAHLDGTWRRLKACGHCHWVVYDHSRNASSTWCSRLACGSRVKARAWQQRKRAAGTSVTSSP